MSAYRVQIGSDFIVVKSKMKEGGQFCFSEAFQKDKSQEKPAFPVLSTVSSPLRERAFSVCIVSRTIEVFTFIDSRCIRGFQRRFLIVLCLCCPLYASNVINRTYLKLQGSSQHSTLLVMQLTREEKVILNRE